MDKGRSEDGPTHVEEFRAAQRAAREAAGLPVQDVVQPSDAPQGPRLRVMSPGTQDVPTLSQPGAFHRPVFEDSPVAKKSTSQRPRGRKKRRGRRRPRGRQFAGNPWGFFFGVAVFVASVIVGISGGLPVLGHGVSWAFCGGSAAVALLAGIWIWQRRAVVTKKASALSAICVVVVLSLFSWGASTSVVLDGKVYAVTSVTARSWQLSHQMVSQLQIIARYNVVLGYPYAEGEAHYGELASGISALQVLVNEWANPNGSNVPNYRFIPAAQDLDAAAAYGVGALTDQQQYLSTDDTDSQALAVTARTNMDENAQAALTVLRSIARHYRFVLKGGL